MRNINCFLAVAIGCATCANGVDFPSSGGNLASADDWGGAVPLNQDKRRLCLRVRPANSGIRVIVR